MDMKSFICSNCTDGNLLVSLCIIIEKRSDNHGYESIVNTNFVCYTLFRVEKEINGDSIFINSSKPFN